MLAAVMSGCMLLIHESPLHLQQQLKPKSNSKSGAAQEEQAEKVRLVDVYNARLTGREQRRAFIRDRGLLNVKRMQACLLGFLGMHHQ